MSERVRRGGLHVAKTLSDFVELEVIPGTGVSVERFWREFEAIWQTFDRRHHDLMRARDHFQTKIDGWHQSHPDGDFRDYESFLRQIGYILPEGEPFQISPESVDPEISSVAGPQLVVPVSNARFSLNAVNARWGSLYDALYGSDVLPEIHDGEIGNTYNPKRGVQVVQYAASFLDQAIPLLHSSHAEVTGFQLGDSDEATLTLALSDGSFTKLKTRAQLVGYRGVRESPDELLFRHNGLHIALLIDRNSEVGRESLSGLKDVILESAVTTIQDLEDSVASVDTEDKTAAYRNWLGLMQGTLEVSFEKNGRQITRRQAPDRDYVDLRGKAFSLPGRSLMLIRNVGLVTTVDAILNERGDEVPEGILDAMVTTLCAVHDNSGSNSRTGSIYIVKPKMHGPQEVAITNELFGRIERALDLPDNTVKIGLMDEERRTTVNLKECIRAVRERVVLINTGYLDRTGDEIHTSMEAGAFVPKEEIKKQSWIDAYERRNISIGLSCGLAGKAQIGKGMWPKPDNLKEMVDTKMDHLMAGANCAWVPSPTAATLHAMHYHYCDVGERQREMKGQRVAPVADVLRISLLDRTLSAAEVQAELENNIQGILGYVVRWIDQGIGCSKVPDINNVALMEDRATLRISSQHVANWLRHGICSPDQVAAALSRMANVVDLQNACDPSYTPMSPNVEVSPAFRAAHDLIFKGREQPNGYTEFVLREWRLKTKTTRYLRNGVGVV